MPWCSSTDFPKWLSETPKTWSERESDCFSFEGTVLRITKIVFTSLMSHTSFVFKFFEVCMYLWMTSVLWWTKCWLSLRCAFIFQFILLSLSRKPLIIRFWPVIWCQKGRFGPFWPFVATFDPLCPLVSSSWLFSSYAFIFQSIFSWVWVENR